MTKQFFVFHPRAVRNEAPRLDQGVSRWMDIWSICRTHSMVDRQAESVVFPYPIKLYPPTRLPTGLRTATLSYEECCEKRAAELIDISRILSLPITLLYSGGVDSTLVLVSFLKLLSQKEAKERLKIVLDYGSIDENPYFFDKFIRRDLTFVSSAQLFRYMDKKSLIVTGEFNDQLHGSALVSDLEKKQPGVFQRLLEPHTLRDVSTVFSMLGVKDSSSAARWYELMVESADRAPIVIKTTFDLFWWLNFVFMWQDVYFRILCYADHFVPLDQDFLDSYYFHFYGTTEFQKWAMVNPHLKIKDEWSTYKFHAKELIYQFDNNLDYRTNKRKYRSLVTALPQPPYRPAGLAEDFTRPNHIDFQHLYRQDHFFNV